MLRSDLWRALALGLLVAGPPTAGIVHGAVNAKPAAAVRPGGSLTSQPPGANAYHHVAAPSCEPGPQPIPAVLRGTGTATPTIPSPTPSQVGSHAHFPGQHQPQYNGDLVTVIPTADPVHGAGGIPPAFPALTRCGRTRGPDRRHPPSHLPGTLSVPTMAPSGRDDPPGPQISSACTKWLVCEAPMASRDRLLRISSQIDVAIDGPHVHKASHLDKSAAVAAVAQTLWRGGQEAGALEHHVGAFAARRLLHHECCAPLDRRSPGGQSEGVPCRIG